MHKRLILQLVVSTMTVAGLLLASSIRGPVLAESAHPAVDAKKLIEEAKAALPGPVASKLGTATNCGRLLSSLVWARRNQEFSAEQLMPTWAAKTFWVKPLC